MDSLPIAISPQIEHSSYTLCRRGNALKWIIGYEECKATYSIKRTQGFFLPILEYIVQGQGQLTTPAGILVPLKAGSFFVYGPDQPVSFQSNPHHRLRKFFLVAIDQQSWIQTELNTIPSGQVHRSTNPNLATELLRELLRQDPPSNHESHPDSRPSTLFIQTLASHLQQSVQAQKKKAHYDNPIVANAMRYLEEHVEHLTHVAQWAEAIHVSAGHLSRQFKQANRNTPYNELMDRRIQRAYTLLTSSSTSVASVAQYLNFADQFHFSRVFKQRTGINPSSLILK